MKASELRIGNLVRVNNLRYYPKLKDVNTEVTGIRKGRKGFFLNLNHSCEHYECDINQSMDFIVPIKITEEWLLRFGFDKGMKQSYFIGQFKLLKSITEGFGLGFKLETLHSIKIVYVHELQNLFFAMTKKELILK